MEYDYVIESDIPIPPPAGPRHKYPFMELNIGESFFIPNVKAKQISGTAAQYARRNNVKLLVRTWTKDGVEGARVWRDADPAPGETGGAALGDSDGGQPSAPVAKPKITPKPAVTTPE